MQMIVERNDFWSLYDNSWSGAIDTLNDIKNADKEDEFMDYLEMVFERETPTDGEVNDFIWFNREMIYEELGLNENGELVDDDELDGDFDIFCNSFFGCDDCPLSNMHGDCKENYAKWRLENE